MEWNSSLCSPLVMKDEALNKRFLRQERVALGWGREAVTQAGPHNPWGQDQHLWPIYSVKDDPSVEFAVDKRTSPLTDLEEIPCIRDSFVSAKRRLK